MNSKLVVKITALIIIGAAPMSVLGAGIEPTRDELVAAIKEEVADSVNSSLIIERLYLSGLNPKGCILWKYIELVDVTVVDKILGNEVAQYKLKPKFKWTASPAEIRTKDGCGSMEAHALGMPVKGGPAGVLFYENGKKYLMIKTDKGWRSTN